MPFAPIARLALLSLVWLTPSAAFAYYPCNGPGPGDIMIGVDNTNGVQTPLCAPDPNSVDPGPGGYWVDQYATLAWGTDPNGGPTYSWYINATTQAEADNGALAQCQASGFRDCRIAMGVTNGAIAVAIDTNGTLHTDWGKDARQAKKKALRFCKSQGGKSRKVEQVLESPAAWVSY